MKETVLCDHGQSASVTDTFGALEKADKAVLGQQTRVPGSIHERCKKSLLTLSRLNLFMHKTYIYT